MSQPELICQTRDQGHETMIILLKENQNKL
jgi:hypothetical protein